MISEYQFRTILKNSSCIEEFFVHMQLACEDFSPEMTLLEDDATSLVLLVLDFWLSVRMPSEVEIQVFNDIILKTSLFDNVNMIQLDKAYGFFSTKTYRAVSKFNCIFESIRRKSRTVEYSLN